MSSSFLEDPHHIRADLKLAEAALKNNPLAIPDHIKQKIIDTGAELLEREDDRTKLRAMQTLLAAENLNIKREALAQADRHHDEGENVNHNVNVSITARADRLLERFGAIRQGREVLASGSGGDFDGSGSDTFAESDGGLGSDADNSDTEAE